MDSSYLEQFNIFHFPKIHALKIKNEKCMKIYFFP